MRRAGIVLTTFVVSMLLVSCMQQQPDMAALKKTVDEYNAASTQAMLAGDPARTNSYYEDNAVVLPPFGDAVKGREAIKQWNQSMAQMGMKFVNVAFTVTDLDASGKLAYEVGEYSMTVSTPQMGEVKDKGKYVDVWRQQQDGSWKIHAETWNSSMPMPSMDQSAHKDEMKKDSGKGKKK